MNKPAKPIKISLALFFFFLIASLDIFAVIMQYGELEMVVKPLITTSLVILYLLSVPRANFWYVLALFFAFCGDTLLLFKDQFFLYGLTSFLVSHILLISITYRFLPQVSISRILSHSVPFITLLALLVYIIYPNLGDMLIPVIVYGIVISVFGIIALLIYKKERTPGNEWLFMGAFTFIASDSILALDKFYQSTKLLGIVIMVTYIVAQYLICKAMIAKAD